MKAALKLVMVLFVIVFFCIYALSMYSWSGHYKSAQCTDLLNYNADEGVVYTLTDYNEVARDIYKIDLHIEVPSYGEYTSEGRLSKYCSVMGNKVATSKHKSVIRKFNATGEI